MNQTAEKTCHFLIADDDPHMRKLVSLFVEGFECSVSVAESGTDALKMYNESLLSNNPVDFIITDYQMPGMDGIQLSKELRAAAPDLPILMMSAHPDPCTHQERASLGNHWRFVQKPFLAGSFIEAVQSLKSIS